MAVEIEPRTHPAGGCPVDHQAYSRQKTAPRPEPSRPALARSADGVWHVRGFAEARQILRGAGTRQAGFKAAALNVLINLGAIKDETFVAQHRAELDQLLAGHDALANEVYELVKSKL